MEGSGGRELRGPMKSVNYRARKVASQPLGKRAVETGNAHGSAVYPFASPQIRKSAVPHFTHALCKYIIFVTALTMALDGTVDGVASPAMVL